MIQPLTSTQSQWVDSTLTNLSIDDATAQLLCISQFHGSADTWLRLVETSQIGAMRARTDSPTAYRELLMSVQQESPIPLLVPANFESGAMELKEEGTEFPWMMAAGAADDEALMTAMGQALAVEARYFGINWAFSPVIDLNYNPDNSITNIRSMGDKPQRVGRLATAMIRSMQAHGLAAAAKHFPGDGIDSRDQHLVTTINSLPFDQWMETYGTVWQRVIDAGVWCIMPGHISLPDYQGFADRPENAPPATISRKLLVKLLREELGYEGLVVSDNASMIGFVIHANPEDRIVEAVGAGIDIYLNADPEHDHGRLLQGVRDGRLSEERIYEAARRVLEMKARLNLFEDPFGPAPTSGQKAAFFDSAQTMADKSITVLRGDGVAVLDHGANVLTVTFAKLMSMMGQSDLEIFDDELSRRGFQVTHLLNPTSEELRQAADEHDAVFINLYITPMMSLGTVRMTDTFRTWGWRSLYIEHPNVYYTAFGSPYVVHELPPVPELIAAYGGSKVSQRSAARVWLGEFEAQGSLPVSLPQVTVKPWPTA